ncbi:hypothetical protein [Agrobacterium pusense]|uniref:hypothetical protein n=1 Tax=Agrobacterium pusense TaxID=648995 RepID=UPI001C6E6AAC|nr:hypothetical protein [Agrobacterium pusense]MBW9069986.1 hypothetical protein [Agrobacterium pusense]MBW9084775.1 hypothetical protein [Agrobacterium pusense]MBW9125351.1 hypothetical protein [Agrobacterium pusense]MBW9137766.1 hypothetical protein [Agrobacterium pusense]
METRKQGARTGRRSVLLPALSLNARPLGGPGSVFDENEDSKGRQGVGPLDGGRTSRRT